jgi:pimeloyl-ACP methyl ester carboxylesterase
VRPAAACLETDRRRPSSEALPARKRWPAWRSHGRDAHPRSGGRVARFSRPPSARVHGFPETWWALRKLILLLAASHRAFAVDLRGFGGFGDSGNEPGECGSKTSAEDLHLLIGQPGVGPVHLTGQDISRAMIFGLAATHPRTCSASPPSRWAWPDARADCARTRGRRRGEAPSRPPPCPGRAMGEGSSV